MQNGIQFIHLKAKVSKKFKGISEKILVIDYTGGAISFSNFSIATLKNFCSAIMEFFLWLTFLENR